MDQNVQDQIAVWLFIGFACSTVLGLVGVLTTIIQSIKWKKVDKKKESLANKIDDINPKIDNTLVYLKALIKFHKDEKKENYDHVNQAGRDHDRLKEIQLDLKDTMNTGNSMFHLLEKVESRCNEIRNEVAKNKTNN